MVMLSERPAEVEDRAVPGHWAGDLIVGTNSRSAVGTLVERSTRLVLLLHLPDDHGAKSVELAVAKAIATLPSELTRSVTWDQGTEMATHASLTVATGVPVYLCYPHSPMAAWFERKHKTGFYANTCPSRPTSRPTRLGVWRESNGASMVDRARHLVT